MYIRFDYEGGEEVDQNFLDALAKQTANNLSYVLNETAETSKVTTAAAEAINSMYGQGYALNVEISTDNTTWQDYIESASMKNKWVVSADNITITRTST